MIVVTGATGHMGGLVAPELARRSHAMRLAVHTASRAPDIQGDPLPIDQIIARHANEMPLRTIRG